MKIQVITRDNGFGLSKDIQVIREAFPDADVDFTPIDSPRHSGHWNWNIHLELIGEKHFRSATVNAYVPNPEWTFRNWLPQIKRFDIILAKTRDCERIFKEVHPNVVYTGWTSPEPGIRVDRTRNDMVHCAGNSTAKGTPAVICAMPLAGKVNILKGGKMPQAEYDEARRAPIHLCPSTYEGFGHYINEARAMGATIITTDAEPMTELVSTAFGILVPPAHYKRHHFATEAHVNATLLAEAMKFALKHNPTNGERWGAVARKAYETDREEFHEQIKKAVA